MSLSPRMYKLQGIIQHYSWGGYEFIPTLLGEKNKEGEPYAEYWLGAHPNHSARILPGNISLKDFLDKDPVAVLGEEVAKEYHGLPFLCKILDVRQMLSIQVHPTATEAEKGYRSEEEKGIPVNAFNRNYKDRNAKPELMIALGDFWLLHGFKNSVNMGMVFDATPELQPLRSLFEEGGHKALFEEVMLMEDVKVNSILEPLLERILPLYENNELEKEEEDFWAARAAKTYCSNGKYDRGILCIYFFNLVYLRKGEGVFQPEGMPHAYLEGQNIEVMSNSDNVLRAGLTGKHVDVKELLKHVKFESTTPSILSTGPREQKFFETPADSFALYQLQPDEGKTIEIDTWSAEIYLQMEGESVFTCGSQEIKMGRGDALLVTAGNTISIQSLTDLTLFRVTVPVPSKNKSD